MQCSRRNGDEKGKKRNIEDILVDLVTKTGGQESGPGGWVQAVSDAQAKKVVKGLSSTYQAAANPMRAALEGTGGRPACLDRWTRSGAAFGHHQPCFFHRGPGGRVRHFQFQREALVGDHAVQEQPHRIRHRQAHGRESLCCLHFHVFVNSDVEH